MTTVESLLAWEGSKVEKLGKQGGDVTKLVNTFRDFVTTVGEERKRFSNERSVLSQQIQVAELNTQQKNSEMERQIFELTTKLRLESELKGSLETSESSRQSELRGLREAVEKLDCEKNQLGQSLRDSEAAGDKLRHELEDAIRRLQYKEEETKRLNVEWDQISQKESSVSKLGAELRAKLSDVENREVSLKYREERLGQEKDIVSTQNSWLTDELSTKSVELSQLRNSNSETISKLQSKIAELTEETSFLKTSNTTLKTHCTKQDKKVGELVNRLQDRETEYLANVDNIRLQLNKQERLTELYNKSCDEYKGKIQELTSAVEEMQCMLKSAEEGQHQLEQHCETETGKREAVIKELEAKLVSLQNELDNANDLLHCSHSQNKGDMDISQLSSTAVTVGGMLKSGMSITQMYTAYVEASEALALEKDKNRLQSQYLDQILKEIEEKAPLLQQQRLDYENSLLNQDNLSNKLERALVEIEHYSVQADQAVLASNGLKREGERHKIRIKDLNQQVQVLLKEVEDTRQGRTSSRTSSPALSSTRVSSSSQVISEQLVSFRSISELQQQNSKLLAVVRELSEEQERRETEDDDPKVVELRAKLDSSMVQVKEVKAAQQRQVEMVEAVARQRDMYRVLLAQAGHNMGPVEDSKDKEKESEHELALKELQKEFTEYKKEKKEQISAVQAELEGVRNEHSTMLTERTKLSSKLDFAEEKYKTLEGTYNLTKADVQHQRTKHQEMSTMVTRLQMTNERTQNEAISNKDEINKLRHSLEAQKKTVDLLRMTEVKQRTQNEALMRETRTQNMLLSNLQTIQNNLERQEFEHKERMEKRVSDLQSELTEARRKSHATDLRSRTGEAMQACQIKELKACVEKEKGLLADRQRVIDSLQGQHDKALADLATLRAQLNTAQFDKSQSVRSGAEPLHHDDDIDETIAAQAARLKEQSQKMTKLQHTIIELTSREESLQEQVKLAKQHAQQYKEISEAHEQALTELQSSEANVRTAHDQLLGQNQDEVVTLRAQLSEAKEVKERLQLELDDINTKGSSELRELNAALKRTQVQLEEARQKEEAARSLESDIRSQFNKLNTMYETSQNNLEDKITDYEILEGKFEELERKLSDIQEKNIQATETMSSVEKKLENEQQIWNVEKRSLNAERDHLKQRSEDLQQQNTLLHTQLTKLSTDVVELQKAMANEDAAPEGKSDDKSIEELWEIIRYVRREKEILDAKIQVTESESVRYKNRCEQLEKQVEESRGSLEEERARTDSTVQSAEQHEDILQKVEQAQALAEQVATLTKDKQALTTALASLKQKIAGFEAQVNPLISGNKDLTDKVNILQTEKEGLQKEVERWGVRCNELIEQCNKVDVKEFNKLQIISNTLRVQLKKSKDDHAAEVAELQKKNTEISEEGERISGEKGALLGNINSIKAESTRTKMELTTVTSELKSVNTLLAQHKLDLERVKQGQVDAAKENADIKKELEDKETNHQTEIEKNQDIITKLRNLAKSYKNKFMEAKEAQANQNNDGLAADLEKVKKLSMEGLRKARQEHETLTARISELETEIEENNVNNKLIAESMETERAESSEKLEHCTTDNAALQLRVKELEQSFSSLTQQLESKDVEMAELKAKSSSVHAETNTDLHRHDQQTNTDYFRTDDTPTASVKPTAITASGTPTAAVRPTSITPDAPPRMATVQPTTSIHISTSSSSSYAGNQPTQVSSSSVQNQAEADTPSLPSHQRPETSHQRPETSHQRPETSHQRPETSHQRPGSSTFHSNKRSREDDDEQPGPSTKIAMVTSSAHIQHQEASCDGSEVSQSTPIFPSTSSHSAGSSHGGALVSSSESVAPSRNVYNPDPVTSSEVARSTSESNEAMPSTLDTPHLDPMEPASLSDDNMLEVEEGEDEGPQVIEIASDSEDGSEEEKEDDDEDDYSGLEDVEEDSRQLQFSFVQSSGTDPVQDVLSADEALQEEDDSNEASEAAPSSTISLNTTDTPWAHIAGSSNTEAAPAASSSSSTNVRGIRRIKRQPKKE